MPAESDIESNELRLLVEATEPDPFTRHVTINEFEFLTLTNEERDKLFDVVGSLPNLEYLEIEYEGFLSEAKLIKALPKVNSKLASITLSSLLLGEESDFDQDDTSYEDDSDSQDENSERSHPNHSSCTNHSFFETLNRSCGNSLQVLCIHFVRFPSAMNWEHFVTAISQFNNLTKLILSAVSFPALMDFEMFAAAISQLSKLFSLEFSSYHIGYNVDDETLDTNLDGSLDLIVHGGESIATTVLRHSISLLELNLQTNDFIESHGVSIAAALLDTKTCLKKLDLSNNKFNDSGGAAIVNSLQRNSSSLISLHLSNCCLGFQSAIAIANLLKYHSTLKDLHLSHNQIGDDGCKFIAAALEQARSLEYLDMDNCLLGDDFCTALSFSLKHNESLQEIKMGISNFDISHSGWHLVAAGLKENQTLQELQHGELDNNDWAKNIKFYLYLNKSNRSKFICGECNNISRDAYLNNMIQSRNFDCAFYGDELRASLFYYWLRSKPAIPFDCQNKRRNNDAGAILGNNKRNRQN